MKSAVFGFRTLTTIACEKILRSGAAGAAARRGLPAEQRAQTEADQVRSAGVADDVEGGLRRRQERGDAEGGRHHVEDGAAVDADHRHETGRAALIHRPRDDEQHGGAGDDEQRDRRQREQGSA